MKENQGIESKEPVKISKIHFLIHPGFLSDEVESDRDAGTTQEVIQAEESLPNKYVEQSRTLHDDEVMIAFTHSSKRKLRRDLRQEKIYAEKLRELKEILGDRLIVLSEDFDLFIDRIDQRQDIFETIEQIASARGFRFDENVLTEAYGETLGMCVEEGAQALNVRANFNEKTLIRPELSNLDIPGGTQTSDLEAHKKRMTKIHDAIKFD